MTLDAIETPAISAGRGGGRIASDLYRQTLVASEEFCGLEENTNRYDLLLLVKRVGKAAGFTPRMVQLLDYYMAFTRDIDWEEGSRPIVYQSLARTALDLGVSERQIQKLEKQLFEAGAVTWHDSGNHKRYGHRDAETGRIVFAYGVELTPLAYLQRDLQGKLHDKQLYDQAWMETKRQISWYRRQIRSILLEQSEAMSPDELRSWEAQYDQIAVQIRTHLDLDSLRTLLARHKELHQALSPRPIARSEGQGDGVDAGDREQETQKSTSTSDTAFVHIQPTKQQSSIKIDCSASPPGFQESVAEPSSQEPAGSGTGLEHVSLRQIASVASARFQQFLPHGSTPLSWADVVDAADRVRNALRIDQAAWANACRVLGRRGAAVCVLLTDLATDRAENAVRNPTAYLRGMTGKALNGELRLHNSVCGLLDSQRQIDFDRGR